MREAFRYSGEPETVIIGDGVTTISYYAFYEMPNVKKIVLPKSLETTYGLSTPNSTVFEGYFYEGTIGEWNDVKNKEEYHVSKKIFYYSETQPNVGGSHWHYVDGVPTVWAD